MPWFVLFLLVGAVSTGCNANNDTDTSKRNRHECVPLIRAIPAETKTDNDKANKNANAVTLEIDSAGVEFLRSLPESKSVSVASIVGPHRAGKSALLNHLVQYFNSSSERRHRGHLAPFDVDDGVKSVTHSICLFVAKEDDNSILLLADSPGSGSPEGLRSGDELDARIASILMAASSTLVWYADGPVDSSNARRLQLLAQYAALVGGGSCSSDRTKLLDSRRNAVGGVVPDMQQKLSSFLPSLLWVLRNFQLRVTHAEGLNGYVREALIGATVSTTTVALSIEDDLSGAAEVRAMSGCFRNITAVALPYPTDQVAHLAKVGLDPLEHSHTSIAYRTALGRLAENLVTESRAKTISRLDKNVAITGPVLADLFATWVAVLNAGAELKFDSADAVRVSFNRHLNERAVKEYVTFFNSMLKNSEALVTLPDLTEAHEKQLNAFKNWIESAAFGDYADVAGAWAALLRDLDEKKKHYHRIWSGQFDLHFLLLISNRTNSLASDMMYPMDQQDIENTFANRSSAIYTIVLHELALQLLNLNCSTQECARNALVGRREADQVMVKLNQSLENKIDQELRLNEKKSQEQCIEVVKLIESRNEFVKLPRPRAALDVILSEHRKNHFSERCIGPYKIHGAREWKSSVRDLTDKNARLIEKHRENWSRWLRDMVSWSIIVLSLAWFVAYVYASYCDRTQSWKWLSIVAIFSFLGILLTFALGLCTEIVWCLDYDDFMQAIWETGSWTDSLGIFGLLVTYGATAIKYLKWVKALKKQADKVVLAVNTAKLALSPSSTNTKTKTPTNQT